METVTERENRSDEYSERSLAGWEIVSVISSILIAEWITFSVAGGSKLVAAVPVTLAFVFIIFSHRLRSETLRDIGFRFDNFFDAGKLLILPMALATILCLGFARWSGTPIDFFRWHAGWPIFGQLALGFGWGLAQQYVLQGFINRRAQIIWGRGWLGVIVVAAIFAALHLPNAWLAIATFVGGVIWATVYQRVPNLFALALSHGLMTWVLIACLPPSALNHLRIGSKYFS